MKTLNDKVRNCLEIWDWQEVEETKETKATVFYADKHGMEFKVSKKTGVLLVQNHITKKWHKLITVDI